MNQVVLVTGTSSGFGHVTAERLARAGMCVYGTSRRPVSGELPYRVLAMNVDDDASVEAGVGEILEREGRIDVVINNAGISVVGSIEDTSLDQAKQQLETNFFGVARVMQAVVPSMRSQRSGLIINVSSIGGLIALPFQAFYSASKFAVEALTEASRYELRPFGIAVCCIEPGDFKTGMTQNRIFADNADSAAYGAAMKRVVDRYIHDEENGSDPAVLADLVERIIANPNPKARYLVGAPDQKAAGLAKRFLPHGLFERAFAKLYRT